MAGDPWGAASGPFPSSGKGGFFQNLLSSQAKALHVTPKTLKNAQPAPPTKAQQAFQDFQNKQGARGSVGHQITHVGSAIFQGVTGTKPSTLGYLAQHPFASVQMKGPYATKNLPHTTINGKSVPLNIGIVPVGFGPSAELKTAISGGADIGMFNEIRRAGAPEGARLVPSEHAGGTGKGGSQVGPKTFKETVSGALKGSSKAYESQRALRAPEVARRFDEYNKIIQENPTEEGARQAAAVLKGVYPKVHWGNFTEFNQETYDAMVKHIADHPGLTRFEPKQATDALRRIRGGEPPAPHQQELLQKIFGTETTRDLVASTRRFHQLKTLGLDVANLPRAVMASIDVSGAGRQGLLIGTSHPLIFAKNIGPMFHGLVSEPYYQGKLAELHARPNSLNGLYDKAGIDFTELTPQGRKAVQREEPFRSPLAEKIPGIRASGRAFTLFLDGARADLADLLFAQAEKGSNRSVLTGRKFAPRDIHNDTKLQESIGSFINSASGRGNLPGILGRSQEGLNLLFFSPRLIKSRVDFLNPGFYYSLDPLARSQAIRAMSGLGLLVGTALGLAHAAHQKVNLDPTSSDFAKIKVGTTRVDLAGGFQQYIRLMSEIATRHQTSTTGTRRSLGGGYGQTSDLALILNFWRAKLAPVVSSAVDVAAHKNAVGQPLTVQNTLLSRMSPLSIQDAVQAGMSAPNTATGIPAGLAAFLASGSGVGVQTYSPRPSKFRGGGSGDPWGASGGGSSSGNPWGAP